MRRRIAFVVSALRTDLGGAALLVVATIAALIWANLPLSVGYTDFWATEIRVGVGTAELHLDLHELVNQGLMTFFFFVIGLEVKRELVLGELADRRRIAVPLIAAVAGMVIPVGIYLAITAGTDAQGGWGTVISTDTAFLLGVLALLGRACPPQLRVLLMALAVADDVGALSVIAVFYTSELHLGYLFLAILGVGVMFILRWLKVWRGPAYLVLGIGSWVALYLSGVEPTLLGVAIAFATETYATRRDHVADAARQTQAYLQSPNPELAHLAGISLQRAVPVNERLIRLWQPWTTAIIVPTFALANAGVPLSIGQVTTAMGAPVTLGVVAGLVVGKAVGILAGTELALRLGLGRLAPGLTRLHLLGGAVLAGMGFTISLFIVDMAFPDAKTANAARIGILTASLVAAVLGAVLLRYAAHRSPLDKRRERLEPPVDVRRDHIRGPVDAVLTLVEYGDFDSAQSHGAHRAVGETQRRLPEQVRFVFRHLVNPDVGSNAQLAAEAAEVAGEQGRFWEMHDALFDTAADLVNDHIAIVDLLAKAAAVGLDQATFATDLGSGRYARRVRQDTASAAASGATASPTFFINGIRYEGPYDADSLVKALGAAAPEVVEVDSGRGGRLRRHSDVMPPWRAVPHRVLGVADPLSAESAETPDDHGWLRRLSEPDLRLLADEGSTETTVEGQILFDVGDSVDDLLVILSGAVAIVEYARRVIPEVSVHERGRFLGEVDLLTHQVSSRTAVVLRPGQVLRLTPPQQQRVFQHAGHLRDTILRTVLLRRAALLDVPDIRVVGVPSADTTQAVVDLATAHGVTVGVEDVAALLAGAKLEAFGWRSADLPLVFTRSGELLMNPDAATLVRTLAARDGPKPTAY